MAKLAYIILFSTRVDAMRQFYATLLRCSFIQEKHRNGPIHYSAEFDGIVLEFYPSHPDRVTQCVRMGFAVSDVDSAISSAGCGNVIRPKTKVRNGWSAVVMDPCGNTVELRENLDDE